MEIGLVEAVVPNGSSRVESSCVEEVKVSEGSKLKTHVFQDWSQCFGGCCVGIVYFCEVWRDGDRHDAISGLMRVRLGADKHQWREISPHEDSHIDTNSRTQWLASRTNSHNNNIITWYLAVRCTWKRAIDWSKTELYSIVGQSEELGSKNYIIEGICVRKKGW